MYKKAPTFLIKIYKDQTTNNVSNKKNNKAQKANNFPSNKAKSIMIVTSKFQKESIYDKKEL